MICNACPRRCGADRTVTKGKCKTGDAFVVARAALHFWEEPPLSGDAGQRRGVFSGCNLNCVYCQNYVISSSGKGKRFTDDELLDKLFELEANGAHNINLVTPSHFAQRLVPVLENSSRKADFPSFTTAAATTTLTRSKGWRGLWTFIFPI